MLARPSSRAGCRVYGPVVRRRHHQRHGPFLGGGGVAFDHMAADLPARIHADDCGSAVNPKPITAQDARAALLDQSVIACVFCLPDTELGIDLDRTCERTA